ncbi:cadherin domain-containing protein [Microvirga flavescens]|uniref:cadherin domain-containing protein n=1 Tax=Microvirga flavescens TaxID=2249811 RepID=UPI0018E097E1|nr:cadherin domain-containing protein [Microvirga flavescens]
MKAFEGGDKSGSTWNELVLRGSAFDFTGKTVSGLSRISLTTDNAVLTIAGTDDVARATALLAGGIESQNDTLVARGLTFTSGERKALHRQGVDTIIDASGTYQNLAPKALQLDGDRITAVASQVVFVDVGHNATLSDDDSALSLLTVIAPRGASTTGRLGVEVSGAVELVSGYIAGSVVKVAGVEVGMLWDAGDISLSIAFGPNGTPERVQEIVRALTYTMADTPPETSIQQPILITLVDEGGRKATSTVTIEQTIKAEPPKLSLSHASVPELAQDGTVIGLLTANIAGAGDAFSYSLIDDAGHRFAIDGDRLVVTSGIRLDYEQQRSHAITVRAKAADGSYFDQVFTIKVEDVIDEVVMGGVGTDGTGTGTGSGGRNTLIGGPGRDKLSGGPGRDKLYGKAGKDTLIGGEGEDTFIFDTRPNAKKNVDSLPDFKPKDDSIYLDHKIFKGLGKGGSPDMPIQLKKAMFWRGTAAHDRNDRLIYDAKKGALLYDANGSDPGGAVKIAVLPKKLKTLSHVDFFVI